MTRQDFEVVNAIGKTVRTFDGLNARKRAEAWAKWAVRDYGSLFVERVTTTVERVRVYRPRVETAPSCPRDADLAVPGWS